VHVDVFLPAAEPPDRLEGDQDRIYRARLKPGLEVEAEAVPFAVVAVQQR
jgi:hypothetical protein